MADKMKYAPSEVEFSLGEHNFTNEKIHSAAMQRPIKFSKEIRKMFLDKYGHDILKNPRTYLAIVIKVLSGPNASDSAETENKNTTTLNVPGARSHAIEKKESEQKIRVIARIPEFDMGLRPPKNKEDFIRICAHGQYQAESSDDKYSGIQEGSLIFVSLRGPNTSPTDGGKAGNIVGHVRRPHIEDLHKVNPLPKAIFEVKCKATKIFSGAPSKFLVGSTDAKPNILNPRIKKNKTKIKTGFYGNGTPQTKYHFNMALVGTQGVVESFKNKIPGPAPGKDNAFIWVGHLRNNGYLDLLDRPLGFGRETIIYAPMTLNLDAPIEMKYYFHDAGGFGHAWIGGPDTTVEQAEGYVEEEGNDFREKISPAIKDLIREKRNFILVIPEMAFSRGFGTKSNNHSRTSNMSKGKKVKVESLSPSSTTIRTRMTSKEARAAAKNYLRSLPASKLITFQSNMFERFFAESLGVTAFDEQAPEASILQKTHFRERETATFDGSYSGGKFGDFHTEVLSVLDEYLGYGTSERINYISILADGLGAINLASIAKPLPYSSTQTSAVASFKSVNINRIDFIDNGLDKNGLYSFSRTPSYTIYESYILPRSENPEPFEFNYITYPGPSNEFFAKIGVTQQQFMKVNNKPSDSKGEQRLNLNAGGAATDPTQLASSNSKCVISLHVAPGPHTGPTKMKVGYAFSMRNSYLENISLLPLIPDTSTVTLSNNFVPNHAAKVAQRASEGKMREYTEEQTSLAPKIQKFMDVLSALSTSPTNFCEDDLTRGFCESGFYSVKRLEAPFLEFKDALKRHEVLNWLLEEEEKVLKYINNREKLQELLSDTSPESPGVSKRYKEIQKLNKDEDHFSTVVPGFKTAIGSAASEGQFNMKKASNMLDSVFSVLPTNPSAGNYWLGLSKNIEDTEAPGAYVTILSHIGEEEALGIMEARIKNTIDSIEPRDTTPSDPNCPSPRSIRTIFARASMPPYLTFDVQPCVGKNLAAASNYQELKAAIPWTPNKATLFPNSADRFSTAKTDLRDILEPTRFKTKTFKYKTRSIKNSTTYRTSPPVWSCIAEKISNAWEAACNVSGYVPFRIFSGIAGYKKADQGVTAYPSGVSINSFGLGINIDSPIAGYSDDGDPICSVFTGLWTPRFVERYTAELYDLGVLYYDPTPWWRGGDALLDSGSRYKDNAYEGYFEKDLRTAQWWEWAEDSYEPGGDLEDEYIKIMKSARDSPIVPYDANPVQWLLTFCEKSGMKWGNSFFMRKRYRGRKTGFTLLGIDFRHDAPISWSNAEQNRIAAIYGIPDVVARINAISWPISSVDNHMHFQYYAGDPIIKWAEIEGSA